ncbi:MAG TPA: lamin tail domain-containing protein, partial [Anaerolineales bacterium]|nr:lamin tail domain-containing protein [Anaerolineales bacterium]
MLINEVAWAGTLASANDEWIELYNPGSEPVDLGGWSLTDNGDIAIALLGVIPPHSFFLLERTDDSSVSDIAADEIYTGNLSNAGESLWLTDSDDVLTDSANASGGAWPAGNSSTRASMERRGGADISSSWGTFSGVGGAGHDAA